MQSRNALVIGATGALGQAVVTSFLEKRWNVWGVDVLPQPQQLKSYTHSLISKNASAEEMQKNLLGAVGKTKLNAVINAAGGWAGGDITDAATAANAELMIRQSLFSSFAAAHVFAKNGDVRSLLLLVGSAAALKPTPTMLSYGVSKSAVHYLCKSIAADPSKMPKDSRVAAILPAMLDTPGNRQAMPNADRSTWTPLQDISSRIVEWGEGISSPENGSLIEIQTQNFASVFKAL